MKKTHKKTSIISHEDLQFWGSALKGIAFDLNQNVGNKKAIAEAATLISYMAESLCRLIDAELWEKDGKKS